MAVTIERLIATLEARFDQYDRQLNKALGNTNRTFTRIESRGKQMERRMAAMGAGIGSSFTKALAVAGGVRGVQSLIDSAIKIDNALKVAGLSGAELENVYSKLRDSAIKNAAPIEAMVTLYGRLAQAQDALNVTQDEMTNFTDKIGVALRVAGASATEASGALLQLSQALGAGTVRAEEYNSINEGARPILQAVAAGLREAGGDVAKLRQLVMDGKVSSEAFFRAFEAGSVTLEEKVAGSTLTTAQGLTNIKTAMVDAMREFVRGSMAAETLGGAFAAMADKINSIDFEAFGKQARELVGLINQIREAMGWLQNQGSNLGSILGTDAIGDWLTGGAAQQSYLGGAFTVTNQRGLQDRIDQAFGDAVETAGSLTEDAIRRSAGQIVNEAGKTGRLPSATVTPVSLDDFAAPSGKGKSNRGGGSRRTASDRFDEDIQAIRDRTAALIEEQKVVGKSYFEQERRRMALDLEQQALRDVREEARRKGQADWQNAELTPEQVRRIDEASEAYARQADELRKIEEAQGRAESAAQEFYDTFKSGMIGAITGAENFSEALSGVLRKLGEMLLSSAFDALLGGNSATGSGGWLTNLFKGLGFRERGGPVRKGQPYIVGEKRAELFVPDQSGTILPSVPQMPSVSQVGGRAQQITVDARTAIHAPNADREGLARLEAMVRQRDAELPSRIIKVVRDIPKKRIK